MENWRFTNNSNWRQNSSWSDHKVLWCVVFRSSFNGQMVYLCEISLKFPRYYEVELLTECSSTQIGWANKNMDIHVEVKIRWNFAEISTGKRCRGWFAFLFIWRVKKYNFSKKSIWETMETWWCHWVYDRYGWSNHIMESKRGISGNCLWKFQRKRREWKFPWLFSWNECSSRAKGNGSFWGSKVRGVSGYFLRVSRYIPQGYKPIEEAVPLKVASMPEILKIESCYSNYNVHIPRTRAFLSHKRSSAQGVKNEHK